MRVGRAYAIGNQVFVRQLESLGEAVTPVLQEHSEAVLVVHQADLYLNGVRLPVNQASFKFQQTVIELFARVRIAGIRFVGGAPANEIGKVFELLLRADGPSGTGLIEACGALGLQCVAPILSANVDPHRGGEPAAAATAVSAEDESIAQQIYEPRIEALEVSGQRRLSQAMQGTRLLMMPTSIQSVLEVRHAKRVVQPLVEGVSLSEPVVVGLTTLRQHDEFTYAHAVNVCGVAVAMGHFLGLDRRALSDLGVAALLHDVGKSAVADEITNDLERFTPEERAAAMRHPVEGAKLIALSTSLNPTTLNCLRVALEHHAVGDGGYPTLSGDWRPGVLAQVVATADCYVSLLSRLSHSTPGVSPHEALGRMLGPLASRFSPALRWALVRAVGFYPAGQVVEMDDGCLGIVLAPDADDLARPHVRVLTSWNGSPLPADRRTEYRPVPPDRFIARALKAEEYPQGILDLAEAAQAA
jgi:HD-GYP domain-containing protein (c-di-GMP phosphodiesterase class II)